MEERNVPNEFNEKPYPFFRILYKHKIMIILVTVLCMLLSVAYCAAYVKPVYTASSSVILRMSVGEATAGNVTSNASLAKLYLPDVAKIIESPLVISKANERYENKGISASSINVEYGEESMIFTISYSDVSDEVAAEKLVTIMTCASEVLAAGAVEAEDVSLISTQNEIDISVNEGFMKYILLGTAAGIVLSILLSILIYALDTTIVDREEFEDIAKVPVLSYISKVKKN